MRHIVAACGLLFAIGLVSWWFAASPARRRAPSVPARLPRAWMTPRTGTTAWIFMNPTCRHCVAHQRALARCLAELPAPERRRVAQRLRVVGAPAGWSAGVEARPAAWRDSLAVRFVPTTLWVEDDGNVCDAWLGARSAGAWQQAMQRHFGRREGGR